VLRESKSAGDPKIAGKDRETELAKEDGEEDDRFGESHGDNRLDKHLSGGFWITAYGFASFHANEANANRNRKGCCCDVNFTFNGCEN
jgi:hypothetical protein